MPSDTRLIAAALTMLACCGSSQNDGWPRGFRGVRSFFDASLMPGCTIAFESTGRVDDVGTWLDCGCGAVFIAHPMNLLRQVQIQDRAQALAFVRLFSSGDTYHYLPEVEWVEIYPAEHAGPFQIEAQQFLTLGGTTPRIHEETDSLGDKHFTVIRTVVSLDDLSLHEIVESLGSDGYYHLVSTRRLAEDARKYGMLLD